MSSRVVVLASGSGTLLQSLLDSPLLPTLAGVGSDRMNAYALERASKAGIPRFTIDPVDFADRVAWDVAMSEAIATYEPDWIVSAGFMRILGATCVERFAGKMINTHPALLPAFPGAHAVRDALAAGVPATGCTVHFIDGGVDTGPIIAQVEVQVLPGDDEEILHDRIKIVERKLLREVLTDLIAGSSSGKQPS